MDLLTVLCYAVTAWGVFEIFCTPVNKQTIPAAILGGIVAVDALILTMNHNHLCTLWAQKIVVSIPMVPQVSDRVVEVTNKTSVLMKRGKLLFRIDDTHYRVRLNELKTDLAAEGAMLRAEQATIDDASTRIQQVQAECGCVTRDYQRHAQRAAISVNPFSEQDVTHARQQVRIQTAVLRAAKVQLQNARGQMPGRYNRPNASTANLKSQIPEAEYNLMQTAVRAPSDSYVTQLLARPGMTVVRLPFKPVLVFIPQRKRQVVAVFRRNLVLRLTAGDSAEIVPNGLPGSVYNGKVSRVLPAIPDGNYQVSDTLQGLGTGAGKEGIYVLVGLDPHPEVEHLPDGVNAQAAVYTDYFVHMSVMCKVLLRTTNWLYYLYLDH